MPPLDTMHPAHITNLFGYSIVFGGIMSGWHYARRYYVQWAYVRRGFVQPTDAIIQLDIAETWTGYIDQKFNCWHLNECQGNGCVHVCVSLSVMTVVYIYSYLVGL